MADDLIINDALTIPRSELEFRASRAGGPGGQHVNRSSTRIELVWSVAGSPSLTDDQRERVMDRLASRLDSAGRLRLVAARRRSQLQNRDDAEARLVALVSDALRIRRPRRKTRVPRAAKERRLAEKRQRSDRKQGRRPVRDDD